MKRGPDAHSVFVWHPVAGATERILNMPFILGEKLKAKRTKRKPLRWNETKPIHTDATISTTTHINSRIWRILGNCRRRSVLHSIVEFIVAFIVAPLRYSPLRSVPLSRINLAKVIAFNCHLTDDKWCWFTDTRMQERQKILRQRRLSRTKIIYFGHMYSEDFRHTSFGPSQPRRHLKSYWPGLGELFNCRQLWPAKKYI